MNLNREAVKMSFVIDLSKVPPWVPSDVLKRGFEAVVDLKYRHLFVESFTEAQRAAYSGDAQNMEKYFKEMRTCNDRFKEAKIKDIDKIEENIRADLGNKYKLAELEELLKSAKEAAEAAF